MKQFYIKISGSAFGIEANDEKEAIEQVKKIAACYCSFTALEIGKDVDELGYPIEKVTK